MRRIKIASTVRQVLAGRNGDETHISVLYFDVLGLEFYIKHRWYTNTETGIMRTSKVLRGCRTAWLPRFVRDQEKLDGNSHKLRKRPPNHWRQVILDCLESHEQNR